jgi:methionine salvage enolase-phosphatase E1
MLLANRKIIDYFDHYLKIQKSGKYNMITDARYVIAEIGCTFDEYVFMIENYKELKSTLYD